MFQGLRERRELRYILDESVPDSAVFIVALDIRSDELCLDIPPGSSEFAAYGATPCPPPVFDKVNLVKMSEESHPFLPSIAAVAVDDTRVAAPAPDNLDLESFVFGRNRDT